MRAAVPIILMGLAALAGCEKPARPKANPAAVAPAAGAQVEPSLTRPRPNLHWDPADMQGLAAAASACGGRSLEWYDQEDAAIAQLKRAKRIGKALIVGKARFVDQQSDPDDAGMVHYRYLGAYGDSGVDAVFAEFYESYGVTLVDQRNGAIYGLIDLPLASADGRFFAAASSSDVDEHGLQIVERADNGWIERAHFDETVLSSPCGVRWESNMALAAEVRWPTAGALDYLVWSPQTADAWGPGRANRIGDTWRYQPPRR